jgi:proline dehydrogenase
MTKYAELPNGKRIPFPDDMSEDKMRRAVRAELGLGNEDILDGLDLIAKKLDDLQRQSSKEQPLTVKIDPLADSLKTLNKTMKEIGSNLDLQSFQSEQFNKTLKAVEAASEQTVKAITKSFTPLLQTTERLSKAVIDLSKDMKEAIDHSTQAIQADLKATMKAVLAVESVAKDMQIVALKVTDAVEMLEATSKLKKKAVRNSDGSWTLETSGLRKH